ncbi:MAG: pilus assembly protein N-terminal domain-containing protein [Sandaracinaceae bacterium]|nr:pilus assembly protein N-terminal domain-containing protein [Sandaracinaceae bacterium]
MSALTWQLDASGAHAQARGAGQVTRRDLTLQIGEQSIIPAQGVASYSEGQQGIIDVRLPNDRSQFIIVAMHTGSTTLLLLMDDGSQIQYRISVVPPDTANANVASRDNVRLDLYFMQVSDTYQHRIGLNWFPAAMTINPGLQVQLPTPAGGNAVQSNATVAASPLPRIDMLQATGWARVLRQTALITANGNEATFNSGGEVNFQVSGALSSSIQRIPYGTELRVLPRYDRDTGRVELRVMADITDLTNDNGSGLPGRTISHLETLVNLELGQSLVLAGLTSDSEASTRSGLPGFSQIPILGALFGTHSNRHERTRNVLFLVPTVVDNVSQQARNRIGEAMAVYEDFDGDTDEVFLVEPVRADQNAGRPAPTNEPTQDIP